MFALLSFGLVGCFLLVGLFYVCLYFGLICLGRFAVGLCFMLGFGVWCFVWVAQLLVVLLFGFSAWVTFWVLGWLLCLGVCVIVFRLYTWLFNSYVLCCLLYFSGTIRFVAWRFEFG